MSENYEKIAENYSDIHKKSLLGLSKKDFKYFVRYKLDIVKQKTKIEPLNILDFGCGVGESCLYIRNIFPQTHITGIDTSDFSINSCKKLNIVNSFFYSLDLSKDDNLTEKYDLIFAACVFHHIEPKKREKVLKKLISALNKNGKLYIFEHNPFNPVTSLIFKKSEIDKGCYMMSPFQLKRMFKKLNMKGTKIHSEKYVIFMPRIDFFEKIFFIEKYFEKIPIGCQYYTVIEKLHL